MKNHSTEFDFLKSACTLENPFMSIPDFLKWIDEKKAVTRHNIEKIKFSELKNWEFEQGTQNLVHSSGKFFSISKGIIPAKIALRQYCVAVGSIE